LYFVRKLKSAKQGKKGLSRYNNNQMLLEKLCLQKWRKRKQNLNCILLPAPLISHQRANLSLLLFSHTRLSPQQKFPHTSNFDMLVLASLSDQQAENLCQLKCQTLDLPLDGHFILRLGFGFEVLPWR
jgi:hypothetical protein